MPSTVQVLGRDVQSGHCRSTLPSECGRLALEHKPAWKGLWLGASILARFGVSAPLTFCLTRQHSHLLAGIAASSWLFGRGIHWVCKGLAFTLLRVRGEHCEFTVPLSIPAPRKPGHLSPSWLCSVTVPTSALCLSPLNIRYAKVHHGCCFCREISLLDKCFVCPPAAARSKARLCPEEQDGLFLNPRGKVSTHNCSLRLKESTKHL